MDLTSLNKDRKKRNSSVDMSTIVWGRVPPQARELEEAVLGAIMLDREGFEIASEIVTAESFYVEANQLIFKACDRIFKRSDPIDILTVVEELKASEQLDAVGGPYYVTKLTNSVVSAANIETHARIVVQKFIGRELIRIAGEIIGEAYEDSTDVFDLRDDSERKISVIASRFVKMNRPLENAMDFMKNLDARIYEAKHGKIIGITSGYPEIDNLTNGWRPGWLITLAAFSSAGKTAFALNLARNAAEAGEPVLFLTGEMQIEELWENLVSMVSAVVLDAILTGQISEQLRTDAIAKAVKRLESLPLYFVDTSGMNWRQKRALIKKYKKTVIADQKAAGIKNPKDLKFVVEDYVQLSEDEDPRGKNREQQVANISRENKKTAKSLLVAYLQLSQITSKKVNERQNKEPGLEDLRESSAIGNDSDIVMILYRPEYHDINYGENGESTKGQAFLSFVKFRRGKRGVKIELRSNLSIQKFYSMGEADMPVYGSSQPTGLSSNWKPLPPGDQGRLFIQKGSKLSGDFDEGFSDTEPY